MASFTIATPVCIFFLCLAWITVLLRCFVRLWIVRRFGWDDATMVFTLLTFSAFCGCNMYIDLRTQERLAVDIPFNVLIPAVNVILADLLTYIVSAFMVKVALGLLLLRVLVKPWMRYIIYGVMAVVVSYGIFYFFFILFMCGNPTGFAMKIIVAQCLSASVIEGTCYFHAALNAIADWIYCILPVFLLTKVNMPTKSKVGLACILGFGSVGSIFSCIRFGWIRYLATPSNHFLPEARTIALLSVAELGVGIAAGSLATSRPFYYFLKNGCRRPEYGSSQEPGEASKPRSGRAENYEIETIEEGALDSKRNTEIKHGYSTSENTISYSPSPSQVGIAVG